MGLEDLTEKKRDEIAKYIYTEVEKIVSPIMDKHINNAIKEIDEAISKLAKEVSEKFKISKDLSELLVSFATACVITKKYNMEVRIHESTEDV